LTLNDAPKSTAFCIGTISFKNEVNQQLERFNSARTLTRMVKLIAKSARIDRLKANILMRKFKLTYLVSGTLTTPATVTESMGLPALALAPMVFAVTRVFHREP
jgi:hypothetical protein